MATIQLRKLQKRYGDVEVLRDINATIEEGEFVVLIGESGCGKSTLLRMICGLEEISGGELIIDGKVANDTSPQKRRMSMVFQSYALYPHMNVFDNMAYGLKIQKTPKDIIRQKVTDAARLLGIEPYLERYPKNLSGGQRQRVAMGRAIVRDPEFFLFDEPLSNLDAKLRVTMRKEIKLLQARLGTTTLYVTHDQVEAMTMADKIILLDQGSIVQIGSPKELYDHPNSIFTATFLGNPNMTLIEGVVQDTPGQLRLKTRDGMLLPIPRSREPLEAGHEVILGIRPRDFYRTEGEEGIDMTVEIHEYTGAENVIYGTLGEQEIRLVLSRDDGYSGEPTIRIAYRLERSHLFDAQTQKALS
jgi:multiple sugar transport system ATP-binding protein